MNNLFQYKNLVDKRLFKKKLIRNSNTPINILKVLAIDKDHDIRTDIAQNKNTPASVLRILAKDNFVDVRCYVARNLNTPFDLLQIFLKDKNKHVANAVFMNQNWIKYNE